MGRLVKTVKLFATTKERTICARIAAKIEKWKLVARHCVVTTTLLQICECTLNGRGYVVDLERHTCTCGYFELAGIPCVHAIAVASYLQKDIYYWCSKFYMLNYAEKAYGYGGIPALPGQQAWEPVEGLVVYPPATRVMPGRPKTVRRKEAHELEIRVGKNRGTVLGRRGDTYALQ
ncbi:hypothetical protein LINGRAPRIM_LOCUS204 [Linum grandiflorum]